MKNVLGVLIGLVIVAGGLYLVMNNGMIGNNSPAVPPVSSSNQSSQIPYVPLAPLSTQKASTKIPGKSSYKSNTVPVYIPSTPVASIPGGGVYNNSDWGMRLMYPSNYTFTNSGVPTFSSQDVVQFGATQSIITVQKIANDNSNYKQVMINNSVYAASGLPPKSFSEFSADYLGNLTFYRVQTSAFAGTLRALYFLPLPNGVFMFELREEGVNWNTGHFSLDVQPGIITLKQILATVSFPR